MTQPDTSNTHVTLSLQDANELVQRILRLAGFSESHVRALSQTLVAGERDGCASHGLYRTLGCVATLHNGKVVGDAEPVVHDQAPSIVRVDACGGFSLLAFELGLPYLIEKARNNGIAALAINHCVHFSALWPEVERVTEAGLVTLICNPSHAWVTPAGGHTPLLGTNPIAFGWPRSGSHPFVFDFATSAIARGEIELHRRAGKPIPEGWGIDTDGNTTTDPQAVINGGAMLTFGGYKGSALSAMIELIAGPLIGDLTSAESLQHDNGAGASPYHGELILAFDPQRFLGAAADEHLARAEAFFSAYQDSGARLPSQRRYAARERSLQAGIDISRTLYEELCALQK